MSTQIIRRLIVFLIFLYISHYITKEELGVFREFSLVIIMPVILAFFSLDYLYIVVKDDFENLYGDLVRIGLFSSLIFTVILFLFSEHIGKAYHSETLGMLIRLLAPIIIMEVLRKTFFIRYSKRMEFRLISILETVNVLFYSLIILLLIKRYSSVWLIVIAFYLGDFLETFLFFIHDHVFFTKTIVTVFDVKRVMKSFSTVKQHGNFCLNTTLNHAIGYFGGNAPVYVSGLLFKPEILGLYYLANQLINTPVTIITASLKDVFFASLAKCSKTEIASRIDRYFFFIITMIFPLFIMYLYGLQKMIPYYINSKWQGTLEMLPVIFFVTLSTLLSNPISSIPIIVKKPHYELIWNAVSIVLSVITLIVTAKYGFINSLIAYTFVSVGISLSFNVMAAHLVGEKTGQHLMKMGKYLLPQIIFFFAYKLLYKIDIFWGITSFILIYFCLILTLNFLYHNRIFSELSAIIKRSSNANH